MNKCCTQGNYAVFGCETRSYTHALEHGETNSPEAQRTFDVCLQYIEAFLMMEARSVAIP